MSETLQELINAEKAAAAQAIADAAVEPANEVAVAEAPVAATAPETPVTETTEVTTGGDTQPVTESQAEPASWLRQFVSSNGLAVDGIPDDEIEDYVAKKIRTPAEVKDEPVATSTQQDVAVSPVVAPSAEATKEPELPARKVQPLKYEADLAEYVTFDEKGNALPKPELGADSIEAAKKLNSYSTERRKRIEALADDPVGLVKDDLLSEVERMVAARIAAYDAESVARREAELKQSAVQTRAQKEAESLQRLLSDNSARLYDLAPNGEPRRTLEGDVKMSPYGKEVDSLYIEMRQTSRPDVPDAVLIAQAMKIADRIHAVPAKDPVAEAQAKAKEVASKKEAFLDEGKKHVPPVTIDKPAATLDEMIASGQTLSLADMIKADAENQGNPVLAKLG